MPLSYPILIRHVLRRLVERCYSINLRHSLTTMCLFLCLSLFTSIIINILIPILFFKSSSPRPTPTSSLSVLSSKHIFFPSDLTSLQCSPPKNHELQAHYPDQESLNIKRKYTKDPLEQKNISSGKKYRFKKKTIKTFFLRSSTRSRNFFTFSITFKC